MTVGILNRMVDKRGAGRRRFRLSSVSLLVGVVLTGLSACGFHLRGMESHTLAVDNVYIQSKQASGPLLRELREALSDADVSLAASREQAEVVLIIAGEQRDRRVLSVGSTGKVQEYELHYAVSFELRDADGEIMLERQQISRLRDFSFSETDVLAKADEEDMLYQDMRRNVVRDILNRLERLK